MNIGEREELKKIKKKSETQIKKAILKECLAVTLLMIQQGQTRKADEAIRVYKKLKEEK